MGALHGHPGPAVGDVFHTAADDAPPEPEIPAVGHFGGEPMGRSTLAPGTGVATSCAGTSRLVGLGHPVGAPGLAGPVA